MVATPVVLGLYAGAQFLMPLTMAHLINVLSKTLSDWVIALFRAPIWLANVCRRDSRADWFVHDHVHPRKSGTEDLGVFPIRGWY